MLLDPVLANKLKGFFMHLFLEPDGFEVKSDSELFEGLLRLQLFFVEGLSYRLFEYELSLDASFLLTVLEALKALPNLQG